MGKKLITARQVELLYQDGKRKVVVGKNQLLAPLARDFAASRQMKIVYGEAEAAPELSSVPCRAQVSAVEAEVRKLIGENHAIADEKDLQMLVQKVMERIAAG